MNADDPTDLLRARLRAARDAVPVPSAHALSEGALRRAHAIRTRRRAAVAGVAVAGVAAVAAVAPGAAPPPMPTPATSGPSAASSPASPSPSPEPAWRVTERCDASRFLCSDMPVDAIAVDGTTYRLRASGSQPWRSARDSSIQLSVGKRGVVHRVLGGVVGRGSGPRALTVRASFDVYVDGHLTRHYLDAPLSLLEVGRGRHTVEVVAVGDPTPGRAVVVGELAPSP